MNMRVHALRKIKLCSVVISAAIAALFAQHAAVAVGENEWPEGVVREAPLPEGWPAPGPVGEVQEKSYPASRTFWAGGNMNLAFMRCFRHLQEHDLEMTAPVVMDYQHHDQDYTDLQQLIAGPVALERLHFVLEDPTLDELGVEGPVVVEDTPALRVLSVAWQGDLTEEVIRTCEQQLQAALAEREGWESEGSTRILGYNSPMVPEERRYWEVQLPIRDAE